MRDRPKGLSLFFILSNPEATANARRPRKRKNDMSSTISDATPLGALTVGQFVELLGKNRPQELTTPPQPTDYTDGYVFGIAGIRRLFNVSHVTACAYKSGFLKPAVKQRGRQIITDVKLAIKLFDEHSNQ